MICKFSCTVPSNFISVCVNVMFVMVALFGFGGNGIVWDLLLSGKGLRCHFIVLIRR